MCDIGKTVGEGTNHDVRDAADAAERYFSDQTATGWRLVRVLQSQGVPISARSLFH